MKVNWIKWYECDTYKNGVSLTSWFKSIDSLTLTMYAILIFDDKEIATKNGNKIAFAIRKQMIPFGTSADKKRDKELFNEAFNEALQVKKQFEITNIWPDLEKLTDSGGVLVKNESNS